MVGLYTSIYIFIFECILEERCQKEQIWLRKMEKKFTVIPFRSPSSPIEEHRAQGDRPETQRDS